eukprot:NODE_476_length_6991_cov_0.522635.p4 type:complete len:141 gc:universal NODE_476_length_6991_cov_0.522635:3328-3750(+)
MKQQRGKRVRPSWKRLNLAGQNGWHSERELRNGEMRQNLKDCILQTQCLAILKALSLKTITATLKTSFMILNRMKISLDIWKQSRSFKRIKVLTTYHKFIFYELDVKTPLLELPERYPNSRSIPFLVLLIFPNRILPKYV